MFKIGNLEVYGVIYKITNKVNGKCYIGQTVQGFDKRYAGELAKYTCSKHLKSSIQKYGIDNFDICKIFDIAFSREELDIKEKSWISIYKATNREYGYNSTIGGEGVCGFHHTEETKQKLRKIFTGKFVGEKHHMYGKHHTEETKRKMVENRDYKTHGEHPNAQKIICITTGEIFGCVRDAQNYYHIHESNIVKCCKGKRKSTGKLSDGTPLRWMYYEEYLKLHTNCEASY